MDQLSFSEDEQEELVKLPRAVFGLLSKTRIPVRCKYT